MQINEEKAIRSATAAVVLDWAERREPPVTGETAEGLREAIEVAHLVAEEGREGLARWVDAGRRAGLSWSEIGDTLGISKQAAQQRFKPSDSEFDGSAYGKNANIVVRTGASAFHEMRILEEEGRQGRELIDMGVLKLVFRQTDTKWEYRRKIGQSRMIAAMQEDGWQHASVWLPFHYFKRPL